jgi:guanylate kinase
VSASIVVVSGPSGSGKTSLCKALCDNNDHYFLSVSTTTREIRDGEKDGVDYNFVSREQFLEEIEKDHFIEWAEVHGNFYGTSKKDIERELAKDNTVVVDIDVQGHRNIREAFPNITTSVFVTTENMDVLNKRLSGRGTDSQEVIQKRMINALGEMRSITEYDYLIINKEFDNSLDKLTAIAKSSRYIQTRFDLEDFFNKWKNI